VVKQNPGAVQGVAGDHIGAAAVHIIAAEGRFETFGEVGAYLMGASGLQPNLGQRNIVLRVKLYRPPVGDAGEPALAHLAADAMPVFPAYRRVDSPPARKLALTNGEISLFDAILQQVGGVAVLAAHHEAGCVPVEPPDGVKRRGFALFPGVGGVGVGQRVGDVPVGGVYRHIGGLVDDNQVVVLV